jgi:hypothetical protein
LLAALRQPCGKWCKILHSGHFLAAKLAIQKPYSLLQKIKYFQNIFLKINLFDINEQRTQYFRDYEKSKRSRQFLKDWKQNRPWLVDTETGMVCSYCKEKKMEIHLLQDVQATNIHTICRALNRPEI